MAKCPICKEEGYTGYCTKCHYPDISAAGQRYRGAVAEVYADDEEKNSPNKETASKK